MTIKLLLRARSHDEISQGLRFSNSGKYCEKSQKNLLTKVLAEAKIMRGPFYVSTPKIS